TERCDLVHGASLETEHRDARAARERAVVSHRRDRHVIQRAIVAAYDDERLVRERARPFEHAVDESGIAGAGDGRRIRGEENDDGNEHDPGGFHEQAPPGAAGTQVECHTRFRTPGGERGGTRLLMCPRVYISAEKVFPYHAKRRWCTTIAHGARRHHGA